MQYQFCFQSNYKFIESTDHDLISLFHKIQPPQDSPRGYGGAGAGGVGSVVRLLRQAGDPLARGPVGAGQVARVLLAGHRLGLGGHAGAAKVLQEKNFSR